MGIDFSKLSEGSPADRATEPRRIFAALPGKAAKYNYPRDVQAEVWEQWHERRDEPDLVVKMNTGSGKTVVGLVTLKSALNEGVSPAVYVTPDNYLAEQVRREAADLGIPTTSEPRSAEFLNGSAVLVTNIFRLVNGRSVFGLAGSQRRLDVGTLLVDDAHACLASIEAQFTLEVPSSHEAYGQLVELFSEELKAQSPNGYLDIKAGDRSAVLPVPFWSWADRHEQVLAILHPWRDDGEFKWKWPLVAECLPVCRVAVSSDAIQIAPACPAIDRIPSITAASRRIYMTATLPDDSVLVTHLGAEPASLGQVIRPVSAGDMGDRMILTPMETHPEADDSEIRALLSEVAREHNVVVIVPSHRRADVWEDVAVARYDRESIDQGVSSLQQGHVGLVVLVGKYDGVDLPGDACRVLVIDGLPEAYGELDRLDRAALSDTDAFIGRQLQRIEQGMGRGVRSNEDYCAVLLLGSRLTERLYGSGGRRHFSPATRAQLELSRSVAQLLQDQDFGELRSVIDQCLQRDPDWVSASRSVLDQVQNDPDRPVSPVAVAQRRGVDLAVVHQYGEADAQISTALSTVDEPGLRGWLKVQAAQYRHQVDPVAAQELLVSAVKDNRAVLRPKSGARYTRLAAHTDQSERASEILTERFSEPGDLRVEMAAILEDLRPGPDTTEEFEAALASLGELLGFATQRPERDSGEGPDVLWLDSQRRGLVIECKSGIVSEGASISRHDAAQLSHSVDWFEENYPAAYGSVPVLVHPSNRLHEKASARQHTWVVTFEKLSALRSAVERFSVSVAEDRNWRDPGAVAKRLAEFNLTERNFLNSWAVPPR